MHPVRVFATVYQQLLLAKELPAKEVVTLSILPGIDNLLGHLIRHTKIR